MLQQRYTPEEILEILNAFYHYQAQFDPEVDPGQKLHFDTTLDDWAMICDLIPPRALARVKHTFFQLSTPVADLEALLLASHTATLRDFCTYVAQHAPRPAIEPVKSLGAVCLTAGLFNTLLSNLRQRGIPTTGIRPSTPFPPLFQRHAAVLLEEANRLAPGSVTHFAYRDNALVRTGHVLTALALLAIVVIAIWWSFHWALLFLVTPGLLTTVIGKQFPPATNIIGGYSTIRDLINGMQQQIAKVDF